MSTKPIRALSTGSNALRRRRIGDFKAKVGLAHSYLLETSSDKKRPFFRRPAILFISAILILTGLIFSVRYYLHMQSYEVTDDAFIDAYITEMATQVASNVVKLHVADNQHVNEGDLLLELDPREFEARLLKAQAALKVAEAEHRAAQAGVEQTRITTRGGVVEASSGVAAARAAMEIARAQVGAARERERQAQAAVTAAGARIEAATAEAKRAAADVRRNQPLYQAGLVSQQQQDQILARAQTANAQLAAAKAEFDVAYAGSATGAAEVEKATKQAQQAHAQVEQGRGRLTGAFAGRQQVRASEARASSAAEAVNAARADVQMAELHVSETRIYATVSGYITHKSVEVGNYVQVGQPLMAIVPDRMWVGANFKETQLNRMRPGQPVTITVDAYPSKTFTGKVDSIQLASGASFSLLPVENATGNFVKSVQRFPVKIVFDEPTDPSYPLRAGMSVVPEVRVR
jgi:membrane fusion protein (multidrug efflux system)